MWGFILVIVLPCVSGNKVERHEKYSRWFSIQIYGGCQSFVLNHVLKANGISNTNIHFPKRAIYLRFVKKICHYKDKTLLTIFRHILFSQHFNWIILSFSLYTSWLCFAYFFTNFYFDCYTSFQLRLRSFLDSIYSCGVF